MWSVWLASLTLMGLLVVVTGCADSAPRGRDGLIDASSIEPGEPVYIHGTIEGIITGDTDETFAPNGARIEISVRNSFNGARIAGSYRYLEGPASFPIRFEVECDPCRLYPNDSYVAHAKIDFFENDHEASYYLSGMDTPVLADDRLAKDVEIHVVESAIITGAQKITFTFDSEEIPPEVTYITVSIVDSLTKESVAYETFPLEEPTELPVSVDFPCDPLCAVHPEREYSANVAMHNQEGYQFSHSRAVTVITGGELAARVEIPMAPAPYIDVTITFDEGHRFPDDAEGILYLKDVSREGGEPRIVSEDWVYNYKRSDDSPLLFSLGYPLAAIDPNGTYWLDLDLRAHAGRACHVAYTTKAAPQVLTKGAPSDAIQLEMIAVDRPQSPTRLPTVNGTMRLESALREDKDPSSPWELQLLDVTRDCVAAHLDVKEVGSFPSSFAIPYNPAEVNPDSLYVVDVFKSLTLPRNLGLQIHAIGQSKEQFTFIDGRPSDRNSEVILEMEMMLTD